MEAETVAAISNMKNDTIEDLILQLDLPEEFSNYISLYFEPLSELFHQYSLASPTPVIGINGSQGSGKTTAAVILKSLLETKYRHQVVILSIDDFYHTKTKRNELAQSLHPLFATRGVPGTHDVDLALHTIQQLKQLHKGESSSIPRFDKAIDDRKVEKQWDTIEGPVSIIIFEGWCIGSQAIDKDSLLDPINDLEKFEDKKGIWRIRSNEFLAAKYQTLFKQIDYLLMLKAPDFDIVYQWRLLQEQKLAESLKNSAEKLSYSLLKPAQLKRFIQHYQRLTEHNLSAIPAIANAIITLNDKHQMTHIDFDHTRCCL